MPRASNLKMLAVYATEDQIDRLKKAAELEHRSLSNYLLVLGLERADELGVEKHGVAPKKRRAAGDK